LKEQTPAGTVFIPFHWGDLFNQGNAANYLTISAIGRVAKQPELKYCAVNVEKIPAPLVRDENGGNRLSLSMVGEAN
jgi:anaerobic selenocysteine-containing dehydrogenase